MRCPKCSNQNTKVVDSRETNDSTEIRRRRECESCEFRFTTFEKYPEADFMVVKNDGSKERYNREKVNNGIWRALQKRHVDKEAVDKIIAALEREWSNLGKEVSSNTIGAGILRELKSLDEVAYIRFASVYQDFQDIKSFEDALKLIKD